MPHIVAYFDAAKFSLTETESVPVAQWLEHCVSSAKVVGSIPREQTYLQTMCSLNAL